MIIKCILAVLLTLIVMGIIVFFVSAKNAEFDPNEPFLQGDYDQNKGPTKIGE